MQMLDMSFTIAALMVLILFLQHKLKARIKNMAGSYDRIAIALRGLTRVAMISVIYLVTYLLALACNSNAWPLSVDSLWGFGMALFSPVFGIVLAIVAALLVLALTGWLAAFISCLLQEVQAYELSGWFFGIYESLSNNIEGPLKVVTVCLWPLATGLILQCLINYGANGLSTDSGGKTLLTGLILSAWCGFYCVALEVLDRLPKLVCTRSVVNG